MPGSIRAFASTKTLGGGLRPPSELPETGLRRPNWRSRHLMRAGEGRASRLPFRPAPRSSAAEAIAQESAMRATVAGQLWAMARRKPVGAVSAVILCILLAVGLLAPWLAPYDPYKLNVDDRGLPIRMQAPNARFLLGTDPLGRDVLSRIVYGARISLVVGFGSVLIG